MWIYIWDSKAEEIYIGTVQILEAWVWDKRIF